MSQTWADLTGVVTLPSGVQVRGRSLRRPASEADFTLMLAEATAPPWPHRRVRWPDFWIPLDRDDALDALAEVMSRGRRGERVEVGCGGGIGRTGTALAALAVMDGVPPGDAVDWVRRAYHPRAVETPWQRRWVAGVPASPP
jgi:protein-tyrosine phosphatase